MSRWFRVYDDLVDDPKVQLLPLELFKALVNIWCLASNNKGLLPDLGFMAFKLRIPASKIQQHVNSLKERGLLDDAEHGLCPHNWEGRQYISDSSAERVKRHREKRQAAGLKGQWVAPKKLRLAVYKRDRYECLYCGSVDNLSLDHKIPEIRGGTHDASNLQTLCMACNGAKRDMTHDEYVARNNIVTLPQRPQSTEADNRTEPYSEKKDIRAVADATRPDDRFEDFWKVYPKRDGANPKAPARKKFLAALKSGADAGEIILGAKRSAEEARSNGQIGTPYVPQAITWLNQQRWGDYMPRGSPDGPPMPPNPDLPTDAELRARYERKSPEPERHTARETEGVLPQGVGSDPEQPSGIFHQAGTA